MIGINYLNFKDSTFPRETKKICIRISFGFMMGHIQIVAEEGNCNKHDQYAKNMFSSVLFVAWDFG